MNKSISIPLGLIGVCIVVILVAALLIINEDKGRVFAVGALDHYEYLPGLGGNRATVIYFSDGTSFVMPGGHYSILYSPGTQIRIVGAGNGNYRIEPVQSQ